ncbi:MAG: zinc-binding alcohol dehydrogenase [Planctomycetes bacterium]|nr:zinc-binding alcohol dehydrogenase [Planctomycetota bacterium]
MPKELYAPASRTAGYRDYSEPELGPKQVRVRSLFGAFKHGTELIEYRDESPFKDTRYDSEWQMFVPADNPKRFPRGLGNMIVGEVVEVGSEVTRLRIGDRVSAHSPLRETCTWPDTALLLTPGMPWHAAVCFDPVCFALAAVRDGQVRLGDNVAVFGLGAIGMLIAQCAQHQGAEKVIVVDPIEPRRDLALKYGADVGVDPLKADAGAEIRRLTDKRGADVCLEVSGNYNALHHAIRGVAFGGNVVAVAYPKACTGGIDFGREAHFNRPNLLFARGCSDPNREHPRWSWARIEAASWRMLCAGRFQTQEILQPVVPFSEAVEAWRRVDESPHGSIKLGVRF